jgi:MFS family permease
VIYLIVTLTICMQIALKGSRMLVALHALDYGASPLAVGLLVALYSLFPMQLALYAGRMSDRRGVRPPMIIGSLTVAAGLFIPVLFGHVSALYVTTTLLGSASIFYQVSAQYTVGALASGTLRTRNFALYSLAGSISGFIGPLLVGHAMEAVGKSGTYAALACFAILPAIVLALLRRRALPRAEPTPVEETGNARLLESPGLRRAYTASAVILTGLDLFNFYMPIYGRSLGLSPSTIGVILSMQAAAAFVVRLILPRVVQRYGEERVLRVALLVSALAYVLYPFTAQPVLLSAIAFGMGLALGCGQPLSMQLTHRYAPTGRVGEAIGMRLTFNRVTQIAVPLVFGSIGSLGVAPVFWANGALLASGSWIVKRRESG